MSDPRKKTEEDIQRISYAMDMMAKLILQKREGDAQLKAEYQKKLEQVNTLINMLLALNDRKTGPMVVDESALDKLLKNGVDFIEKDEAGGKQRYALIPVMPGNTENSNSTSINKKKKKKKNKIHCSYCNETGHTRAACPTRLLNPKPSPA